MSGASSHFGEYRLVASLGQGGMADVYLAIRSDQIGARVHKLVVIKRLRDNLAEDPEFVSMLMDEARLAAKLNHPAIVQTNEFGKIGDQYYLSMEFLDGQPLHRILHRMRAAEQSSSAFLYSVLLDILSALSYAHALTDFDGKPLNIIHRDVTPQNIFVTYDGAVKLVDFGIAKASGRTVETRHGIVKGKIAYMSPEQAMARSDIDSRSDLFAIGVLLYEAAVGDRMWKGKDERAILRELLGGQIPHPSQRAPSTPAALDAICRKATAREPRDRFSTAAEMQAALEAALQSTGMLLGRRELSRQVSELFKDKRAQLNAMIEDRIAALASKESATGVPTASISVSMTMPTGRASSWSMSKASTEVLSSSSSSNSVPSISVSSSSLLSGRGPISQTNETEAVKTAARPRVESGARYARLVATAALLVFAVAAVILALRFTSESNQTANKMPVVTPSAASAAIVAPTPSNVVAPRPEVQIVLKGIPADVRFQIDEGPLLENPYVGRMPRSPDLHRIRAVAPGYRDRLRTIRFESNMTLELVLEKDETP
jgi:serine/threonine-protein kinase